jgi:para-nitrobenzyl esterase
MPLRIFILLISTALLSACGNTPVELQTPNGRLQGYIDEQVENYLGVPYAQPPVGELRWRAPQPVQAWDGLRNAQQNSAVCVQFSPISGSVTGEEDCLYVNVWTPTEKPAEPMPVMVWIHGGGFIIGQGSYTREDWRRLAARENVVVVSINYRLGIFGFLAHQALTAENPNLRTSGNYGIQDQTAALRWVRNNISAFGGDPDNVTIFGQSAGGISVCAQLASPAASGLFQRAVIQSGPCASPMSSLAAVSKLGAQAQTTLGCNGQADPLACMRNKSAEQVANTLPPDPTLGFGEGYTFWWPVHDELVLPRQFMDAFESGQFNQVPVINGATLNEASLLIWMSHNMRFKPLQPEQYMDRLAYLTGSPELAQQVATQYPLENYDSPYEALTEAFSDGFFNCIARLQSQALSRHVPTWSYQFDYEEAPFLIPWADLKAYHAAELQYIMGRPMSFTRRNFKAKEVPMANSMMGYWAQFARSGNPNRPGPVSWPAYDSADKTLLFNLQNSVVTGVHEKECRFWEALPYLRPSYQ